MSILQLLLSGAGIGIAVGVGFVAVIIAVVKLGGLFKKLFPKKAQPEADFLEEQMSRMGRDYIVFSYDMKLLVNQLTEKLTELRMELWAKDHVLPSISIATANFPTGKNCVICLEGKEIFNGEINPDDTDEKKINIIISTIRIYFSSKSYKESQSTMTPIEKQLFDCINEVKNECK